MKKEILFTAGLILLLALSFCSEKDKKSKSPVEPVHLIENYNFDPSSDLVSRMGPPPHIALKHLRELDSKNYTYYLPTEAELGIIRQEFQKLPARNLQILQKRMVCMFFINGFLGSGMTEWITDNNGRLYSFIVFNTETIKKNISDLLVWKEKTCFKKNNPAYDIEIDCGTKTSGFLYILLHESTHVVDYASGVTPFTEEAIQKIRLRAEGGMDFTFGIWSGYYKTSMDMPFRKDITFYGFSKGPKINISSAASVYRGLSSSPFPSLYASSNWAEDLAEMLTFYHLTQKMDIPYTIRVKRNGKTIYSIQPMNSLRVKRRFSQMKKFYSRTDDIDRF